MKQILLMIAVVALVGCGEKGDGNIGVVDPAPNSPLPNSSATDTPEPFAARFLETKTEAQIEAENKAFAEAKAKAEAGDAEMQNNLGVMYVNGEGVEQDLKEAVKWYRKAADQGLAEAQNNLGFMYGHGQGVEQNFKEMFKWWQKAADQGNVAAQYSLGFHYYLGVLVLEDYVNAYAWWYIAVFNGNEEAKKGLPAVAKAMTPAQIAKAEELIKEMIEKNPKLLN